jgi:hypothetical protein
LLQWEAHLSGLQQSKQAVLLPELFLVVLGVSLTRGEAAQQQALFRFVPRGPLGSDPPWISLEFNPPLSPLFRTQPLGKGAQSGADSVAGADSAMHSASALKKKCFSGRKNEEDQRRLNWRKLPFWREEQ